MSDLAVVSETLSTRDIIWNTCEQMKLEGEDVTNPSVYARIKKERGASFSFREIAPVVRDWKMKIGDIKNSHLSSIDLSPSVASIIQKTISDISEAIKSDKEIQIEKIKSEYDEKLMEVEQQFEPLYLEMDELLQEVELKNKQLRAIDKRIKSKDQKIQRLESRITGLESNSN